MRFLVTGATGFIGQHLTKTLIAGGHSVVAVVRNRHKARTLPKDGVEFIDGDLSLFKDPDLAIPRCDMVIHLAGVIAAENEDEYRAINFGAVTDLVESLKRQSWQPKRLLFASSLAAAGPSASGQPVSETDVDRPIEPYGQAKKDAEEYLAAHAPFPTTSFRPAIVLGPGDPAALTLFKLANRGLGFRVWGIRQRISFVSVDDLVDAIIAMASDTSTEHRVYFVSHPDTTDVVGLWTVLGEVLRRKVRIAAIPKAVLYLAALVATAVSKIIPFRNQLDLKQYRQMTAPAFVCSPRALQNDFQWEPRFDLVESIQRAASGYQAQGML